MKPWLTVIGVGDGGVATLSPAARRRLDAATVVFGGARHLAALGEDGRETIAWGSPLTQSIKALKDRRGEPVAILASGDPMWFGIGATLSRYIDPAEMEVLPSPSAFSLAAARLGWPLQDCLCLSVHGRPLATLRRSLADGTRLLVLTDDGAEPARIAALLTEAGFGASRMTVLEHLGGAAERQRETQASAFDLDGIADLNLVAVTCGVDDPAGGWGAGPLPDEAFTHDGKMTKRVLRALALSALAPHPGECLWDIGAGSGAISVEWLRAARAMRAIALEPLAERRAFMAANAERHGVPEIEIRSGRAPEALDGLPTPDAVFIGGGLSQAVFAAAHAALRPGGRLVAHAVTLESEAILLALHAEHGGELLRIGVERAEPVGSLHGWKPAMPVIHWHLVKGVA
ncbi:precorrin-6y C5,15-methyltransferase (decarboxylating) subunit CbiE [Mangrovicella endophytica]|uniref:precorrin-6y C5,15-methyltransferase (decarboxylating) subunit CbiE n=1 Tax=Mangrovicella endophytica TaxID=2066697 RepID=UPI000C9DF614|nr:precorrin-6y C5,15-methyltransferase (decarboxylating) subunit CbiE [Mangrovicella endophytica]